MSTSEARLSRPMKRLLVKARMDGDHLSWINGAELLTAKGLSRRGLLALSHPVSPAYADLTPSGRRLARQIILDLVDSHL